MAIPRPEPWYLKLLKQAGTYEIIGGFAAAFVAISNAKDVWAKVFLAIVGILAVGRGIVSLRKQWKEKSIHELEGCLHALHGYLVAGHEKGTTVRITIHLPIDGGQHLEQISEYVGGSTKKRVGRKFPAQSGVIGYALRRKEAIAATRKNDNVEQYARELIEEWHYTEADAAKCNPAIYSWLAIPLLADGQDGKVECIVYADSNKKNFFSDEAAEDCANMCAGIARFIRARY